MSPNTLIKSKGEGMKGLTLPFYIRGKKINSLSFFSSRVCEERSQTLHPFICSQFQWLGCLFALHLAFTFCETLHPDTSVREDFSHSGGMGGEVETRHNQQLQVSNEIGGIFGKQDLDSPNPLALSQY
jgi:hypothetical protein